MWEFRISATTLGGGQWMWSLFDEKNACRCVQPGFSSPRKARDDIYTFVNESMYARIVLRRKESEVPNVRKKRSCKSSA